MWQNFPLFPAQASTQAGKTDALYFFLLAVTAFFTVLIFLTILVFAIAAAAILVGIATLIWILLR